MAISAAVGSAACARLICDRTADVVAHQRACACAGIGWSTAQISRTHRCCLPPRRVCFTLRRADVLWCGFSATLRAPHSSTYRWRGWHNVNNAPAARNMHAVRGEGLPSPTPPHTHQPAPTCTPAFTTCTCTHPLVTDSGWKIRSRATHLEWARCMFWRRCWHQQDLRIAA